MASWAAGLFCLLLAACAGQPSGDLPVASWPDLPDRVRLDEVPFYAQAGDNDCGPAALATMLAWSGMATDPDKVFAAVYTPGRSGTLQHDLVAAARRYGRLGVEIQGLDPLMAELAAGHPVLVLQNLGLAWWPQWHYAVVIGYDQANGNVWLRSGTIRTLSLSFKAFLRSWSSSNQWGLVVTSPERLPALDDEIALLQAASGIERAQAFEGAFTAYHAILKRWPESLGGLMGWGNTHYAKGDLETAAKAFKTATALHPHAAEAWNNLAYTQARLGDFQSARRSIGKALELGGIHAATAQSTSQEIEAMAHCRSRPAAARDTNKKAPCEAEAGAQQERNP